MNPIEKTASVHWEGQGKQGRGAISTQTAALNAWPYGFGSRFQDERRGTNPEELLAATAVDTRATVRLVSQGDGFLIDRIALQLQAVMPEITLEARLLQG